VSKASKAEKEKRIKRARMEEFKGGFHELVERDRLERGGSS